PGEVETRVRLVARLVDEQEARHDPEQADRDVHEEDPVPGRVLRDETADEGTDCERECGCSRPDSDRRAALTRRERRSDDRQGGRVQEGGTRSLEDARTDEEVRSAREAAE